MKSKEPHYVSFWTRLLAHNIDLIPILALLYISTLILPKAGYDLFLFGGIYMIYHVAFEASKWQATPGKRWSKIRVANQQLGKPNFFKIVLRNFSKIISLILFFGGFILIIFHPKNRGLHDFIGGTMVLFDE